MSMPQKLEFLSKELVHQILEEAFQLLNVPGIKVHSAQARELLAAAGASVEETRQVVHIPERLVRSVLEKVPSAFYLYDAGNRPAIHYGEDQVHFDPGSSGLKVLDAEDFQERLATTPDLIRLIQTTEMLPQYDAQSTAVVCHEVPQEISDLYRLYLVLLFSAKPVVTGTFSASSIQPMIDMLAIFSGSRRALMNRPRAVFDVCPSPPLIWSEFGCQNLIELARNGIPTQIVSMPLAGAAAPVTLLGSVVQHAAETLSGIVIHQLAQAGSPVIWGGAAAILDMRHGTTPMGAMETAMIDAACAQIGKSLNLPTHAYLGASDAKIVDAQAGLESGLTLLVGAMAGINMISGAGMLDYLACLSAEKLVLDAEAIAMVRRLLRGMTVQTEPLATEMFREFDFKGEFLKQKITRQLYRKEQYIPSQVIDRASRRAWQQEGSLNAFQRARKHVDELLGNYQRPEIPAEQERALHKLVTHLARQAGMDQLPSLAGY